MGGREVFAEAGLESGPEVFDRIQVRGVGGQEEQLTAGGIDQASGGIPGSFLREVTVLVY